MCDYPIILYPGGNEIINKGFMKWMYYVDWLKNTEQLTFTNNNLFIAQWLDKKEPPKIRLGTIPSRNGVVKDPNILDTLAHEWGYRIYAYYDQVKHEKMERYVAAVDHSKEEIDHAEESLVYIVKSYNLDDALDFFAVLAVEWACKGYLEENFHPTKIGYPLSTDASQAEIDEWVTKFELWSFLEGFHVSIWTPPE